MLRPRKPESPFGYFNNSPEVIGLVVLIYVRFALSLRNVEDLLLKRDIDICHAAVRHWWDWFRPMFVGEIRCQREPFATARTDLRGALYAAGEWGPALPSRGLVPALTP